MAKIAKICSKCEIIDLMPSLTKNGMFQMYDEDTNVQYFTNPQHLSNPGLQKVSPVYRQLYDFANEKPNRLLLFIGFNDIWCFYNTDDKNLCPNSLSMLNDTEGRKIPIIRSWTGFFHGPLKDILSTSYNKTNCKYKCRFVDRNNEQCTATDAYVFHSRNLYSNDLPENRNSDQLFILFGVESPYYFGDSYLKMPSDYFNATSTYRMDSDYPFPYFSYVRLEENEKPMWNQSQMVAKLKNKYGIAVINSNCETPSKRETYVSELAKHITIMKKGECYGSEIENCPRYSPPDCRDKFLSKFKFYLAFENSVCQDYVTEKFAYQSEMLIPIVLKRSSVGRIVPNNEKMFIAADDFESPKKLADYLRFLENNDAEFLKYFDWVKRYRISFDWGADEMCKLCEDIYKSKEMNLQNAKKFIVDNANCYDNYAETLLTTRK